MASELLGKYSNIRTIIIIIKKAHTELILIGITMENNEQILYFSDSYKNNKT